MAEQELKEVTVYTDGSCLGNPGPGGYGVVLLYGGKRKELSAGFALTTNNRMEILAAVVGLETLKEPCRVTLYTDSQYVIQAMEKGWAVRWQANGWRRATGEPAISPDLWERLLQARARHETQFKWVKGHSGDVENERCDVLGRTAASQPNLPPDVGYDPKETSATPALPAKASPPAKVPPPSNKTAQTQSNPYTEPDSVPPVLPTGGKSVKVTRPGQPCRKCGTPVIKKEPKSKPKQGQLYRYQWYLYCPKCTTMYMVEDAAVPIEP